MYECSATWQGTTRGETPLDRRCRCIRQYKHDGPHRCHCEPVDFFRMAYDNEDD